ncbi:hypothetical protein A3L11_08895 [Thermococcus siculi]|uniref:Uncharacterized protein n=1 Tax=Thermococcus siculi TaxID=72803 RepID=A0A2Z2MLU3_9EURY|nr:DUF6062 family protein [Thermococcus siculi]ASJ09339.1 hypothetical protein A3L11_08895 [Thermococcus siculi]
MDLVGIYIREAFEGEGCPVCRTLQRFEEEEIGTILYEHVNDPAVREQFKASLGLCPYHAWRLFEVASSNPLYGGLGVAIIYEHMLRAYLESFDGGIVEGKCHLCFLVEEKERLTVTAIAERMDELLPVYRDSKAVLCKRHYELLLGELEKRNPAFVEQLKEIQREKLENLRKLLEGFIENSDYRSERGPSVEESRAIRRSIEALKGLPLGINITNFGAEAKGRRKGIRFGWKV